MLPRRSRLAREDFSPEMLRHSRRLSSANFSFLVPENVRGYAVIISKKTVRLSVTRHRLKRRVLAALRSLPLPPALIVYPRITALDLSLEDLKKELLQVLSKITARP